MVQTVELHVGDSFKQEVNQRVAFQLVEAGLANFSGRVPASDKKFDAWVVGTVGRTSRSVEHDSMDFPVVETRPATKRSENEVMTFDELVRFHRDLTFDMSGSRKLAKPAGGCPLDGGVRPHLGFAATMYPKPKRPGCTVSRTVRDFIDAWATSGETT